MAKLTSYTLLISLIVALGAFSYGFGFAVFVTSIGQPGFYIYFKLDPTSSYTAKILGAINALVFFGAAIGALLQSPIADRWGRKIALASAAVCGLVGSALAAGSVHIGMLTTVRILQGCGFGMLLALVPLYLAEVAPHERRGLLTGLTVMSFGLGYVICAWISVGAYHATNLTLGWRLPLALACVGPLALLIGLPFVPESPRFLVWAGKTEEAWAILQKLHHTSAEGHDQAARAELTQMVRQVEYEKEIGAGFVQMFTRPSWRRRTLLVMFLLFSIQSTGIYGITNFLVIIFGSLGMTGDMPLVMYAIHTTVGTIAVLVSILIVDKLGRRTMFLIGFPALCICLLAEALLSMKYLGTDNKAGNAACILFMFLYIIFFQFLDAPAFIWVAEVFPMPIRAKGISLALFSTFTGAITFTAPSALAFKNLGWRMYLIYCALCVVGLVIVFFWVPETKGIPIEEIGALFGDEVAVHLTADGKGIVEDKQGAEEIEGDSFVVPKQA